MAFSGQHVFSGQGTLFAELSDDGKIRIWNTETNELKQEFKPKLHLTESCTAIIWIQGVVPLQEAKDLYIAMGTSDGNIALYSYVKGEIKRIVKNKCHSGKVTGISCDRSGRLFTCGEDRQIIMWHLADGRPNVGWYMGDETPHSIVFLKQSNNLVVGARQINVYSVSTHQLVESFTGHTSEVNLMSSFIVNESVEYIVSTSKLERIICLWKIGKKKFNKTPSCTLLLEDIATTIACQLDREGNLQLASVTRSGVIHVYVISIDRIKTVKPAKPTVTIEIACESAAVIKPIAAKAALLQNQHSPQILIGYGKTNFLAFECLVLNFSEKVQVLVRTDPQKLCKDRVKKQNIAHTLKTLTTAANSYDVDYKSSMPVSKTKLKSMGLPLESRLQNLHLNYYDGTLIPDAQSKVQLLVQSLHSKDKMLLRSVLCTNDMKTIQLTLQKLPVQYVGGLVNELTRLMQQKRMNVEFSMNWLKVLAQTHSSQLLAHGADDLLSKFGPCIGIIEQRSNCLKELSKLNGRLQLLVSQIKRNTEEEEDLNNDNVMLFEDNDSYNSEIEDSFNKSTSDGEYEEDDNDEAIEDNENEEMQI